MDHFPHILSVLLCHLNVMIFSVRKSQSMGILNIPDPKQSLVAWENKSYYIDR